MEMILWLITLQGKVYHMQIDAVLFEKFKCTIENAIGPMHHFVANQHRS